MKKTDINQLIHDLTKLPIHIEEIYQWTYQRDGKKFQILHIQVQPQGKMQMGVIRGIFNRTVAEYTDIYFTLYYTKEVQQMIDQGLGRFFLICQPENRVYQCEGLAKTIHLPRLSPSEVADKSLAYIEGEKQKAHSFLEGYLFYMEHKKYAQAAFMLHQTLELLLRAILMMLTGDEKHTHCHFEIIAHLKVFDSKFAWLNKKDKYRAALGKLGDAYRSSRYQQGFQISKVHLERVHELYEEVLTWLDEYQMGLVQEIKKQLSPEYLAQQKMKLLKESYLSATKTAVGISDRELILKALQIFCEPQSVRCFAYQNKQQQCSNLLLIEDEKDVMNHYYLVVGASDDTVLPLDLQGRVNQLLPDHMTVTLIVETQENIIKHVQQGQLFFCKILQTGEVWFEEKSFFELDTNSIPTPHRSMTYLKKQWESKVGYAKALCAIHHTIYNDGDEGALCCAMALATEQICAGLIRTCLGYCPPILNLNYLMRFVDLLCPEVSAVFSLDSPEGREKFKILNNAVNDFRYAPNYKVDEEVIGINTLMKEFIDKSEKFASRYFQTLAAPIVAD